MDETMKGLREEMGPLSHRMLAITTTIGAEKRGLKPEEQAEWDRLNKDYDALKGRYDLAKRAHDVKASLATGGDPAIGGGQIRDDKGNPASKAEIPGDETRNLALKAWCATQMGKALSERQLQACRDMGLNPASRELVLPLLDGSSLERMQRSQRRDPRGFRDAEFPVETRNLSTLSGATGGFLIPPGDLVRSLEINLLAFGGMRQVAQTIRTATGERIPYPTMDDTSNSGVQLGEGGAIGTSVDPKVGLVYLDAYKFSSQPVLMPNELIQDSAFNLGDLMGKFFGTRLGRITNKKYTTGTGAATPNGIVTAASAGVTAAGAAVVWTDFIKLIHSIDPAYREGGKFMWHDLITQALRLLLDTTGRPLWEPLPMSSMQNAPSDRIGGYEYVTNQDMTGTQATGTVAALFGQLGQYMIRSVGELRMYHLVERYRDNDLDAFIGFIREDGNLLQAGTPPVKKLTMP